MTSNTKTYQAWANMKNRCNTQSSIDYPDYGGRGITVCPEWASFRQFLTDMGEAPEGKSIDRKDNDKGYSKNNCRWASSKEQNQNNRWNHNVTHLGETHCVMEWARRIGLKPVTLYKRLERHWSIARALLTPTGKYR